MLPENKVNPSNDDYFNERDKKQSEVLPLGTTFNPFSIHNNGMSDC